MTWTTETAIQSMIDNQFFDIPVMVMQSGVNMGQLQGPRLHTVQG